MATTKTNTTAKAVGTKVEAAPAELEASTVKTTPAKEAAKTIKETEKKKPGKKPAKAEEPITEEKPSKTEKSAKAEKSAKTVKPTTTEKSIKLAKTAKKATSKKKEMKAGIHVQYAGKSFSYEELVSIAKDVWKYDLKKKAGDLADIELYVKPEENMVYCVFNGGKDGSNAFHGSFNI